MLILHSTDFSDITLSDDDFDSVSYSLNLSPKPSIPELQTWISCLGLSVADKQILLDGGWLNANLIAAGAKLLKERFPNQNGLEDTCSLCYKNQWNSVPESFVQILFVNGNHWLCVSNKLSKDSVEVFDSLHTLNKEDDQIACQVSCILATTNPSFDIDVVNVHQQEEYDDCGLFALAYAFDLCAGNDPFEAMYNQNLMRSHLLSCFENGKMKPFPTVPEKSLLPRRVLSTTTIEVYCHCRQVEKLPMASCDECDEWFHHTCEQIPQEVFNSDIPWSCSLCKYFLTPGSLA